jgi:osmotically-inducible protein OsmY
MMSALAASVSPPGSFVLDRSVARLPSSPTHEADALCRNRIQHLLHDQRYQELREIQITSADGVITLQGNVSSFYLRQLCIRCCQQVVGVFRIDDQLQVA